MAKIQLSVKLYLQGPSHELLYGKKIKCKMKGGEAEYVIEEVVEEKVGEVTKYFGVMSLLSSRDDEGQFPTLMALALSLDRSIARTGYGLHRVENPYFDEKNNALVYRYTILNERKTK